MATTTVVSTPEPVAAEEDFEVTREWVESLFANTVATLGSMGQTLTLMVEQHNRMLEMLSSLQSRLPENLTQLIAQQQETITRLTNQVGEIASKILEASVVTSTLTPPVEPTPIPEPVPVAVVNPEAETSPVPQAPPRRRKI